jgi:VanZ family protein
VEFVQTYFPPRTVSLNDIVVESLGGLAGVLLWLALGQPFTNWLCRFHAAQGPAQLAAHLAPAYLLVLVVQQLMPFDFILNLSELHLKFQEGKVSLVPFFDSGVAGVYSAKTVAIVVGYLVLGFLWGVAQERTESSGTAERRVVYLALSIATGMETLKFFVYSRYCDTTNIVLGTLAVCCGWRLAELLSRHRARFLEICAGLTQRPGQEGWAVVWTFMLVAWLAMVLFINWRSFGFTTEPSRFAADSEELGQYGLRRMSWLPLVDYYWGSKYHAFDQYVMKTWSFMPLGVLAALLFANSSGGRATCCTLLAALLVAGILMLGNYFLPARTPSVTDLLLECQGAWIGLAATRFVLARLVLEPEPGRGGHAFLCN